MTDPKLREARIAEAKRRADKIGEGAYNRSWTNDFSHHLIDLIESDWRPEPEVDAVTLAAREWMVGNGSIMTAAYIHDGNADQSTFADAFRAGHALAKADQIMAAERWRPEVRAFADLMEAQLRANDHKPGWKGEPPWPLVERLFEEAQELADELQPGSRTDLVSWSARVAAEAADVANFAMMIADVCGTLKGPAHD